MLPRPMLSLITAILAPCLGSGAFVGSAAAHPTKQAGIIALLLWGLVCGVVRSWSSCAVRLRAQQPLLLSSLAFVHTCRSVDTSIIYHYISYHLAAVNGAMSTFLCCRLKMRTSTNRLQ